VAFNNYVWGVPDADILVGGVFPASGITVNENYTYRTNFTNTLTADIGSDVVTNQDLVCTNNYFVGGWWRMGAWATATVTGNTLYNFTAGGMRSEEHTSELQSLRHLVCRLLLEKKKTRSHPPTSTPPP